MTNDKIVRLGAKLQGDGAVALRTDALTTHISILGTTGGGKCLAPETPVMLHSGHIVRADEVKVGDQLMGPASQPRTVQGTTRGRGPMYRIVPVKGNPWVCNDAHILTVVRSDTNQVFDVPLMEHLNKPDWIQGMCKQFFTAVDFPACAPPSVDPYFLGVWFGDGRKQLHGRGVEISKPDPEILQLCQDTAKTWGLTVSSYQDSRTNPCPTHRLSGNHYRGKPNPLTQALRELVGETVTIPDTVKYGSREVRKAFLAGFLDTDGHLHANCFDFVQKRQDYAEDVAFIAKSLGIQATVPVVKKVNGDIYYRVSLSGDMTRVPLRLARKIPAARKQIMDVTRTGFSVVSLGEGDYAGFTLDGDGRFLLGDFTVTHNSGTVFGIVEELAMQGIPSILVDVKGDMTNIATQNSKEVQDKIAVRILTPGASHGEAVNVFAGLNNPDRITNTVSAILKMLGLDTDPIKSKPHAYLSTILAKKHTYKQPCSLIDLVYAVQDPGFSHLGAMDLDQVIPLRTRTALASKLNNILVAPSFEAWRSGTPLEVDSLLRTRADGRTPITVFSVAHIIDDEERMFAVALLLDEVQAWVRRQSGTPFLRALVALDEAYGMMPPHPNNPPTKKALITLLKQGRAVGLGMIIATQNTMDLDYKGLSNCQTWLIGRLQTGHDRKRVIEGICAAGPYERNALENQIGKLTPRQFLLVRHNTVMPFFSRNVSTNMKGPLTQDEIEALYTQGLVEAEDELAVLRQQLYEARRMFTHDASPANAQRVAEVENKVSNLENLSRDGAKLDEVLKNMEG